MKLRVASLGLLNQDWAVQCMAVISPWGQIHVTGQYGARDWERHWTFLASLATCSCHKYRHAQLIVTVMLMCLSITCESIPEYTEPCSGQVSIFGVYRAMQWPSQYIQSILSHAVAKSVYSEYTEPCSGQFSILKWPSKYTRCKLSMAGFWVWESWIYSHRLFNRLVEASHVSPSWEVVSVQVDSAQVGLEAVPRLAHVVVENTEGGGGGGWGRGGEGGEGGRRMSEMFKK